MTGVKICGLTRPEDAQAAVAAGADAIGLVFAPSPRRVDTAQAGRIIRVLPPQIVRVGVFVDQDPGWIQQLMEQLGLDRLQFHGQESMRTLGLFSPSRIIKALRPRPGSVLPRREPASRAGAYLVDAYVAGVAGGTGCQAPWDYALSLKRFGKPLILSGGLTPANVKAAIRAVGPDMVDVCSGVEIRPGIKSAEKMRAFVKAAKAA